MKHSQYTANPLNPPYQGDFEDFAPVEIIGKCILISRVYYIFRIHYRIVHSNLGYANSTRVWEILINL